MPKDHIRWVWLSDGLHYKMAYGVKLSRGYRPGERVRS